MDNLGQSRNELHDICAFCHKSEDREQGVRFSACGKCRRNAGRNVLYCSRSVTYHRPIRSFSKADIIIRKCQVSDWNSGVPRPHKQICGRRLDHGAVDLTPAADAPKTLADFQELPDDEKLLKALLFPPPRPGFRRSAALIYQMGKLQEERDLDYLVRDMLYSVCRISSSRRRRFLLPWTSIWVS